LALGRQYGNALLGVRHQEEEVHQKTISCMQTTHSQLHASM